MRLWVLWFALIPLLAYASDQDLNWGEWQEAKTFYDSGKYEDAIRSFESHPRDSANYYYDLASVYYKEGQLGPAVGYFEKANRMQPHDPDTQHNLQIARAALARLVGSDKIDPASTWPENLADQISLDEVRGALGLFTFLLVAFWIRSYRRLRRLGPSLVQPGALVAFVALGLSGGLYFTQKIAESHPPAVSLTRQAIRSGPGDQFLELGELEAGSKIRILGPVSESLAGAEINSTTAGADPNTRPQSNTSQEIWRQIRYSQDGIGWVRSSSLLLL